MVPIIPAIWEVEAGDQKFKVMLWYTQGQHDQPNTISKEKEKKKTTKPKRTLLTSNQHLEILCQVASGTLVHESKQELN